MMKTHKIYKIMLMALMLFTASLFITGVDAEAKAYKAKAYKAKTVKVASGRAKTVKTKKKIKKVKIVSKNKNFTVKKTGNKKFKVSGTDKGKTQTVKVTYTNKYTQKFKIKTVAAKTTTIPSYAQKIVNELKPLLADPDKGLQTVLNQWLNKKHGSNSSKYEPELRNMDFNGSTISKISLDEVMKTYTPSQKKALILEVYFRQRMTYSSACKGNYAYHRKSNAEFKKLYNGTFKGVCSDGAKAGYDICQYLGIKSTLIGSAELNHGWCAIYVTDKNGVSYWHGIYATSDGYNLKGTASVNYTMTQKQVMASTCKPNEQTWFTTVLKRASHKPAVTAAPPSPSVTTQIPVQTPAPQTTPTPKPSPTTTTIIFNTPEPPEPEETKTPVATTKPTKTPVVTQEPTPTPIVTPEPTVKPTPAPAPTETPVPQRIVIPYDEHGYTCPDCDVSPYRHKSKTNPYISNFTKVYGNYTVYEHNCNGTIRYFDADGNEYIDINHNGDIMDEIVTLAG